ncbi:reverse transcriptase domain-containing protein [Tanacetum coccineum]
MNFMVVRSHSPYNGIIGRPGVRRIKAIPSTAHGMLKFPVTGGTVTLRSSRIIPLECAMISGPRTQQPVVDQGTEEKIQVVIHPEYPEQTIAIGSTLTEEGRKKLCGLLRQNLDIFAWKPADMTGVVRHIAEHRLNIREGCFPVRQKKRGQASERNKAICEEVEKLVNVNFKDLNKACPKDGYSLPEIDWKVESLCGYPFKCFLDAYKGYHQIKMAKEDEEKTAFITSQGIFCYSKMPFGLKNAGATYQRLVDKAFQKQIGQNLEAYVDDLAIVAVPDDGQGRGSKYPFIFCQPSTARSRNQLHSNGKASTRPNGSGAGLILINPEGMEFTYALRFRFDATNNEVEYEALITRLKIAEQMGVENLQANRTENKKADALSKIASTSFSHLSKQVLVEELREKSINTMEVLAVVEEEGDTWMTPIFKYLSDRTLPAERKKARTVKRKSWRFSIINGILYKKSFIGPWLRCVGPLQANYVLREIHEGSCSMHAGTRSVVAKALRIGYYWPTMHKDARKLIQACQDCQVHKPVPRNPQQRLSPITSPWSFYKWGIDIAGPFLKGPGKVKFLIVAIDYFTKWIEAKPVATITGSQIKKFVWDNIVCRFGLPWEIISDNEKQFQNNPFKDCLGEGIKARLDERSKNWMEELPHVLWAHRTMIKSSNGDTPFSLTYGTVIPAEIGMPTLRTAEIKLEENKEALEINLDLLEERREQAAIREAKSKAKMERYYNSKVRSVSFKPGDLVYRNNEASRAEDTGKLGPKWEGPYEVTEALKGR